MPKDFDINGEMPLQEDGIKYGIFVNRGQPLLLTHVGCIKQISKNGLKPIIVIGSTNQADEFFDPVNNPLTFEQRVEQLQMALAAYQIVNYKILELPDVGNGEKWVKSVGEMLDREGMARNQCVFSYFQKENDGVKAGGVGVPPLAQFTEALKINVALHILRLRNDEEINKILGGKADDVSASKFRKMDLSEETEEQRATVVTLDFIRALAFRARKENPSGSRLNQLKIPVTMLDLTLDRLRKETTIETESLLNKALSKVSENQSETLLDKLHEVVIEEVTKRFQKISC